MTVRLIIPMRLDTYISDNALASSRTEAKKLILSGAVAVNGIVITKPSFDISDEGDEVKVDRSEFKYVSRGGFKLESALFSFNIDCRDKLCIDVGASSGGFTDCLLQNGAKHVIAVDSGSAQLVDKIACDPRVTVMENYNARYMKRENFEYAPTLAVMDVSFISATYIIQPLYDCLDRFADFVCLIKPQFEVGRENLGKGGIVKDARVREMAIKKVVDYASQIGFNNVGWIESPIKGGDGNIEFLAHFKKSE